MPLVLKSGHMILMWQSYLQEAHFNKKKTKPPSHFCSTQIVVSPSVVFICGMGAGALFCVCQTSDQSISTSVRLGAHKNGEENWPEIDQSPAGFPPSDLSHHPHFFKVTLWRRLPRTPCGDSTALAVQAFVCRAAGPPILGVLKGTQMSRPCKLDFYQAVLMMALHQWNGRRCCQSPSSKYLFLILFPTTQNDAKCQKSPELIVFKVLDMNNCS